MSLDGNNVNFLVAFVSGLLTFLASCLLPLVPTYLSYISGLADYDDNKSNKELLKYAVCFVLGFILIFVLLGATVNTLGFLIHKNKYIIQIVGGIFLILMGILITGFLNNKVLLKSYTLKLPKLNSKFKCINSFLVGLTFGFGWTPCVGPVLAVILFMATNQRTTIQGILLLLTYGIGLGIPFILVALGFEKILKKIARYEKFIKAVAGILVIATGIIMLTGQITIISIQLVENLGLTHFAR